VIGVQVDESRDAPDQCFVVAERHDVGGRHVVFDVHLENRVEHLVGRQRLVVTLVGAQFGRRRLVDDLVGDHFSAGTTIDVVAQFVHRQLEHVLDDGIAAHRIAVQREVANGHLALVSGGENHPTVLVRQSHHDGATDTALQVFFGEVGRLAGERFGKHVEVRGKRRFDCDRLHVDAEVGSELCCIGLRALARISRRHRHTVYVLGTQRVDGNGRNEGRVDSTRQSETDVGEAVLADVVTRSQH